MASPGMSRSGRVLKKSIRLMEMETDFKTTPTRPNLSTNKSPKPTSSIESSMPTNLSLIENAENSFLTPIQPSISTKSNLKIKLNLSGDIKVDSASTTSNDSKSMGIFYLSIIKNNINVLCLAIVFKLNPDSDSINFKRPNDSPIIGTDTLIKKMKFEHEPIKKVASTKLIVDAPKTPVVETTKVNISPIQLDRNKIPQMFATSTPKANTAFSSGILAKSIQEQKRINQRARMLNANQQQMNQVTAPDRRGSIMQTSNSSSSRSSARTSTHHGDDDEKNKKKPAVSAYVLWCRETRSEMQSRYPDLNFVDLSRKMGEIWHTLAQNEKAIWFKKAHILTNSDVAIEDLYTQDWISDDLRPKTVSSKQTLPITADTVELFDENFQRGEYEAVDGNELHKIDIELIDCQGYLNILGDSLETIGSYLQRGVKYNSKIEYSKSTALSTMLDTALVAMGTLTCLTKAIPKIAPKKELLVQTLEEVTYFMPPSDLVYDA